MKIKLLPMIGKSTQLKAQQEMQVQFQERSALEEEVSQALKVELGMPLRRRTEAIALVEEAGGLTID